MRPRDESGVKHKKKAWCSTAHRFHTVAVMNANIFLPDTFEFP